MIKYLRKERSKILGAITGVLLMLGVSTIVLASMPTPFEVQVDNRPTVQVTSGKKDTREALEELGLIYDEKDIFVGPKEVEEGMKIQVKTIKDVKVNKDGIYFNARTNENSVKDFLDSAKIHYKETDLISPNLKDNLHDNIEITIKTYDEIINKKTEEVKFNTVKEYNFDKEVGHEKVLQKGQLGQREIITKIAKVSGIEVSKDVIQDRIVKKPIDKIIEIGTKEIKTEDIDFKTETRNNSSLLKGQTKVVQNGKLGQKQYIYEVKNNDRKLVKESIVKKPVNKIVEVGTKKAPVVSTYASARKKKPVNKIIEVGTKKAPVVSTHASARKTTSQYSLRDLQFHGVIRWNGFKYTYYSQSVLPGSGLNVPGRHVSSLGYVTDGDGYIVGASNASIPKGTVFNSPFGAPIKIYDRCPECSPNWIDIYTR